MKTLNNKLMIKPYVIESLKTEVTSGFASARQASRIVGIELLADGKVGDMEVKAGQKVFFEERTLNEDAWAKKKLTVALNGVDTVVMLADAGRVVGVK